MHAIENRMINAVKCGLVSYVFSLFMAFSGLVVVVLSVFGSAVET